MDAILSVDCVQPFEFTSNIVGVKYYHREKSEIIALCNNFQCSSQPLSRVNLSYLQIEDEGWNVSDVGKLINGMIPTQKLTLKIKWLDVKWTWTKKKGCVFTQPLDLIGGAGGS
ncbi:hypothetical protein ID858_01485 [Xenorhabdus sp. DI]|uniref:hypothetical protein n=1 Tax=Xenorhabdus doucetiae TaxID=351671 RepID=UPI0019AE7DEC|nr:MULTISPECIES: hypothetical protein [unclassified Xenorhabdus]MBD2787186.1 hypothetical protein [Xenorhabdus sp. DI]